MEEGSDQGGFGRPYRDAERHRAKRLWRLDEEVGSSGCQEYSGCQTD